MITAEHLARAARLIAAFSHRSVTLATAESCTGGLVAGCLTAIAGSSAIFERGFVTYSNEAKTAMLGVPTTLIDSVGAVSRETAIAMAEGALMAAGTTLAIAVTGIAGPGGGSAQKPVGLVHFALARRGGATETLERRFADVGRDSVRSHAITTCLDMLEQALPSFQPAP